MYKLYVTTVLRDVANAAYHGKYERDSLAELLQRIEEPKNTDKRTAQDIISSIADKL